MAAGGLMVRGCASRLLLLHASFRRAHLRGRPGM